MLAPASPDAGQDVPVEEGERSKRVVVDAEPAACPVATGAAPLPAASWYRRKASEGTTRPIEHACARQRVTRRKEGLPVCAGWLGITRTVGTTPVESLRCQ